MPLEVLVLLFAAVTACLAADLFDAGAPVHHAAVSALLVLFLLWGRVRGPQRRPPGTRRGGDPRASGSRAGAPSAPRPRTTLPAAAASASRSPATGGSPRRRCGGAGVHPGRNELKTGRNETPRARGDGSGTGSRSTSPMSASPRVRGSRYSPPFMRWRRRDHPRVCAEVAQPAARCQPRPHAPHGGDRPAPRSPSQRIAPPEDDG